MCVLSVLFLPLQNFLYYKNFRPCWHIQHSRFLLMPGDLFECVSCLSCFYYKKKIKHRPCRNIQLSQIPSNPSEAIIPTPENRYQTGHSYNIRLTHPPPTPYPPAENIHQRRLIVSSHRGGLAACLAQLSRVLGAGGGHWIRLGCLEWMEHVSVKSCAARLDTRAVCMTASGRVVFYFYFFHF